MRQKHFSGATSNDDCLLEGQDKRRRWDLSHICDSDAVWAWAVAVSIFIINFIILGLERISSILYVDFMHLFKIDRKMASVPFSIQQAARHLFGPVAGILGQKYGLRFVTILGGIIGSLSAIIIYFKLDFISITIFWGLFFGLSTALTTTLNQVSVDQYFTKHRATAGGFVVSGGCVGAFVFPGIIEHLVAHYRLSGTFLVIGSITLNVIPAAMILIEPLKKENETKDKTKYQRNTQYGTLNVDSFEHLSSSSQLKNTSGEAQKKASSGLDLGILENNKDIVYQFLTMELPNQNSQSKLEQCYPQKLDKFHLLNKFESFCLNLELPGKEHDMFIAESSDSSSTESDLLLAKSKTLRLNKNRIEKDSIFAKVYDEITPGICFRRKLEELYQATGIHLISRFPYWEQTRAWKVLIELRKLYEVIKETPYNSQFVIPHASKKLDEINHFKTCKKRHSNSFCAHIKTAVRLHSNPLFLLICVCRGVFMMSFIPVITIIVDYALDKGLKISDSNYVIASLSLGDLMGRLCLGWITDRGFLSLPKYMLSSMLILGFNTAVLPLMTNRRAFIGSLFFFGVLQGSLYVRHPILVSKYMKSHEQAIGMGFINLLSGFLGLAHPDFIGYFRDTLGSYDKMFYLNGLICALVGLLWTFEPFFVRISSTKNEKSKNPKTARSESPDIQIIRT